MNSFFVSVTGYKNKIKNKPSQDFLFCKSFEDYFLAVVCDGHSLDRFKYSHIGAELACRAVEILLDGYSEKAKIIEELKSEKFQIKLKLLWRKLVYDDFYSKNYKAYRLDYINYGTTICFSVVLEDYLVFFNLGDCKIMLKEGEDYSFVFEDNNYIYVNSLAHIDCQEKMQFKVVKNDSKSFKIALFSDGFFNSFESYEDLKKELEYVFFNISQDVFTVNLFKKEYSKRIRKITYATSLDDTSVIFLYK